MEKLVKLPIYWQLLILVGLSALIYYGFYTFMTSDTYVEAVKVNDQAAALQRKNEQARIATQRIDEFRQLFAAKTAEYDELKVLLPEQREITNVLSGLQDTAQQSSLTMLRFTPQADAVQGFITAKPVEVEVASNFNNLKGFYEKMAKLPRIVSITDFSISQRPKQEGGRTLDSKFLLTAYYASPEPPPVAAPAPGAKPGAPAAPGASPAPNVSPNPANNVGTPTISK